MIDIVSQLPGTAREFVFAVTGTAYSVPRPNKRLDQRLFVDLHDAKAFLIKWAKQAHPENNSEEFKWSEEPANEEGPRQFGGTSEWTDVLIQVLPVY